MDDPEFSHALAYLESGGDPDVSNTRPSVGKSMHITAGDVPSAPGNISGYTAKARTPQTLLPPSYLVAQQVEKGAVIQEDPKYNNTSPMDSTSAIARMVGASVATSHSGVTVERSTQIAYHHVDEAIRRVRAAARRSNPPLAPVQVNEMFFEYLRNMTIEAVGSEFATNLSSMMIQGSQSASVDSPSIAMPEISSASSIRKSDLTATIKPSRYGRADGDGTGFFSITALSHNRENLFQTTPANMRISQTAEGGLSLPEGISAIRAIHLLEVFMSESPVFTSAPEGARFYIRIAELPDTFNRQSDGKPPHGHFVCRASPSSIDSPIEIKILTAQAIFQQLVTKQSTTFTFQLLDEHKNPLELEKDVYQIDTITWSGDIVGQPPGMIVHFADQHDIRNADQIKIRGVKITENPMLVYNEDRPWHVVVLDAYSIRVPDLYRSPIDGRTVELREPMTIVWNNIVRITLGVTYIP